jgi:hypothetical protein
MSPRQAFQILALTVKPGSLRLTLMLTNCPSSFRIAGLGVIDVAQC